MENSISCGELKHARYSTAFLAHDSTADLPPTIPNGPKSRFAVIGTQGRQLISWIGWYSVSGIRSGMSNRGSHGMVENAMGNRANMGCSTVRSHRPGSIRDRRL